MTFAVTDINLSSRFFFLLSISLSWLAYHFSNSQSTARSLDILVSFVFLRAVSFERFLESGCENV